jgi:hypothetical protein
MGESGPSASAPLAREADVPPMAWMGRERNDTFRCHISGKLTALCPPPRTSDRTGPTTEALKRWQMT